MMVARLSKAGLCLSPCLLCLSVLANYALRAWTQGSGMQDDVDKQRRASPNVVLGKYGSSVSLWV